MRTWLSIVSILTILLVPSVTAEPVPQAPTCAGVADYNHYLEAGESWQWEGTMNGHRAQFIFTPTQPDIRAPDNVSLTLTASSTGPSIKGYYGVLSFAVLCGFIEDIIDCVEDIVRLDPRCTGP